MLKNDQSLTCLSGKRVKKSAQILNALGNLDELIAFLGAAKTFTRKKDLKRELEKLQKNLVFLGGFLAGAKVKRIDWEKKTKQIEKRIKKIENKRQRSFLLPGRNQVSAFLHLSRVMTRKLERRVVGLRKKEVQPLINYLNRLSLFLFWLALKEEK